MKSVSGITAGLIAIAITVVGCTHIGPGSEGWVTLFDGTNLNNWNRVGNANWRVLSGVVQADSSDNTGSSFLVSKASYKNFVLRVEFWASHDANSGIFMRCANPKKITDRTCYEANIFDQRKDPSYGTGGIVHLAQVKPMPKAGGRWNLYEITADGPELTVVLNGNPTVYLRDSQFASGPIALQWGRGIVKFRKVEIKPL
ncbi:MAG: DUF1080 domain-containing protein [Betaproteobacteria bacterium]|nr:DUF1080 domain-containing protein [Betaproteobacteria bacterium]